MPSQLREAVARAIINASATRRMNMNSAATVVRVSYDEWHALSERAKMADALQRKVADLRAKLSKAEDDYRAAMEIVAGRRDPPPYSDLLSRAESLVYTTLAAAGEKYTSVRALMCALYGAAADERETKIISVLICKIRRVLEPRGIGVEILPGVGYRLAPVTSSAIPRKDSGRHNAQVLVDAVRAAKGAWVCGDDILPSLERWHSIRHRYQSANHHAYLRGVARRLDTARMLRSGETIEFKTRNYRSYFRILEYAEKPRARPPQGAAAVHPS